MGARQDAHQRRLAGAVAADQPDDLAGIEVDRHVVDGVDAAERDTDVAHLDERRSASATALSLHRCHVVRLRFQASAADGRDQHDAGDDVLDRRAKPMKLRP